MNKFTLFAIDSRFINPMTVPDIGKFPGGEIRVKLDESVIGAAIVRIKAVLLNSDDIMTLVMIVDALRESGTRDIHLTMPYIPYARQDRVCNKGEAFSIRAFAKIINSLAFTHVYVWDAHSNVSTQIIDRCTNVPMTELIGEGFIASVMLDKVIGQKWYLISPDKGATEKTKALADILGVDVIIAEKVRDLANGNIIKTVIYNIPEDFSTAKVLIADDIIDGGRTFIEIAKALPKCAELHLFASHGIFSQGKEVFNEYFDSVWVALDFTDFK